MMILLFFVASSGDFVAPGWQDEPSWDYDRIPEDETNEGKATE
jgi:hypothetical protein